MIQKSNIRIVNLEVAGRTDRTLSITTAAEYHKALCEQNKAYGDFEYRRREWNQREIKNCFLRCDFKEEKQEDDVQKFWSELIPKINAECHEDVMFCDTHAKEVMNGKKPDIVIKEENSKPPHLI